MEKDCMSLQSLKVQCREKLIAICDYKYTENDGLGALNELKRTCTACRWNVPTCCNSKSLLQGFKKSIQSALDAFTREAGAVEYRHVQLGPMEFDKQVVPDVKNAMKAKMHALLTDILAHVTSMRPQVYT